MNQLRILMIKDPSMFFSATRIKQSNYATSFKNYKYMYIDHYNASYVKQNGYLFHTFNKHFYNAVT